MRESKELILASKKYAHEIRWRSWWHLGSTLCIFGVLVTLSCSDLPWFLRVLSSVVSGLVMVRLFVIYHDYQHGSILSGSSLARWIMVVYGVFTLSPPSIWNRSHNHHHKNNSKMYGASIGSYPVMTTAAYAHASTWERIGYAASRHPLTIGLGYITIFLYGMCFRSLLANPRQHLDSALALMVHFGLVIGLSFVGWDIVLLALVMPLALGYALGAYLFYAQHNFSSVKIRDRHDWNYVFAALHSSSYIKMSPLMHWFTANIGYHHVHHLNARIPFYRLPEAMAGIEEMQSPRTTSLAPFEIIRCLRLKLWDAEKDRLVTFKEARQAVASRELVLKIASREPSDEDETIPQGRRPRFAFKEGAAPPLRKAA